jgi:hypothetical protein
MRTDSITFDKENEPKTQEDGITFFKGCVIPYSVGPRFNGLIGGRGVRYSRKSVKSNVF